MAARITTRTGQYLPPGGLTALASASRTTATACDRFFIPQPRNTLFLSTSLTSLIDAGASTTLDPAALAVFLRAGFFVGDDPPFAAIRAIPPSASLEWSDAGPAITSGWVAPKPALLSRAEAIERFGDNVHRRDRRTYPIE